MAGFFIRDTKSSSGTFLNHARLSPPGVESKPTLLKDGDVIQLGVDYQGEIYRCVKMRLELNRSWQQQANAFSTNTLKTIRSLTTADAASCTDCCICLFRIASFQSLFVAPCSHVYHYKCIRPMLMTHHPGFLCPLCRTFADLEAIVEIDDPVEEQAAVQSTAQVESPVNAQEPIEQICDAEPTALPPPTSSSSTSSAMDIDLAIRPVVEEASLPTPTSAQAHTFLPQAQETSGPGPIELDPPAAPLSSNDAMSSPRPSGGPTPSSSTSSLSAHQQQEQQQSSQASASATVSPMNISTPTAAPSSPSNNSLSQQSPSSAFLMAPSPPLFVTSFATTPIPFAAAPSSQPPSSSHTQPSNSTSSPRHSSSPSSPGSHMGHMIQNFVRNISIPHRNRSRTNSSSAVSPPTSTGGNHHHGHHHGPVSQGSSAEVLGKTLVMSSPPSLMLANHRTGTGHSGFSDLGAVSEQDVEGTGSSAAVGGTSNGSPGSSSSSSSSRSSSHDRGEAEHSRPVQTVAAEATA
ncbi:hypothetical protein BG015_003947 [Linnemannia schmuckeri]|uniref:SMAD/FHA domain-containing protein n=1 Tax=Linnemannia schmuckeri TaxID=64567 RepID=A0A9P5RFV2_9FUNG|nr:hypothetical protein BG015_003947 [Linnemannia schmuckeri]